MQVHQWRGWAGVCVCVGVGVRSAYAVYQQIAIGNYCLIEFSLAVPQRTKGCFHYKYLWCHMAYEFASASVEDEQKMAAQRDESPIKCLVIAYFSSEFSRMPYALPSLNGLFELGCK